MMSLARERMEMEKRVWWCAPWSPSIPGQAKVGEPAEEVDRAVKREEEGPQRALLSSFKD